MQKYVLQNEEEFWSTVNSLLPLKALNSVMQIVNCDSSSPIAELFNAKIELRAFKGISRMHALVIGSTSRIVSYNECTTKNRVDSVRTELISPRPP